ncbi:FG-GAP repeat protein [Myxococcus landrumensis]|uniref:Uncharacterized protein n=1 Tax=Myxococcus landrumensis TaxID=2813577 RepID=A0ABX7N060_9BACT|nr:FG-GAP repeat protein [Myxococcus landrumus]QSQ12086.1 hypothetical protein JY572_27405 [Myxococcus landrumus]
MASNAAADDFFGTTVAIHDQTLVVGATGDDSGIRSAVGSAYVFAGDGTTWTFQARLSDFSGQARDSFGRGLANAGTTVSIGASGIDPLAGSNIGGTFVYTRTGST